MAFNPLESNAPGVLSTRELCAMIDDINAERRHDADVGFGYHRGREVRHVDEDRDQWNEAGRHRDW